MHIWICVYASMNVRNGRGREEVRKFWNDMDECLRRFESWIRVVLNRDNSGRVGCSEIAEW